MPRKNRQRGVLVMLPSEGENPWENPDHFGEMTVRELVGLVVFAKEFPKGLDTKIKVGDVEGNEGVSKKLFVMAHKPGDVVLYVDMHCGDEYDPNDNGVEDDT